MQETWDGFNERVRRLNPIWNFARGMNLSHLQPYAQMLGLSILLEVFYRELNGSERRTRLDLLEIAKESLRVLELDADEELVERLVNGLMYSGDPREQQPFKSLLFQESDHVYRYLCEDEDYPVPESYSRYVYRLTSQAQEIVFTSREISEEMSISIEALYTIQLIKKGNFKAALRSIENLVVRVRRLIRSESERQEEIKRNPQLVFQFSKQGDQILEQFEDEKRHFADMLRLLNKIESANETRLEISQIINRVVQSEMYHDELAKLYVENRKMESEIRLHHIGLMWKKSRVSLKKTIWQDGICQTGLVDPDAMEAILAPLFSPRQPFSFPLSYLWDVYEYMPEPENEVFEEEESDDETFFEHPHTDWSQIALLWSPIFCALVEHGEYFMESLRGLSVYAIDAWLTQQEAIDLFMMFKTTPLVIDEMLPDKSYNDERMTVILEAAKTNPILYQLRGKKIVAESMGSEPIHLKGTNKEVKISSYRFRLVTDMEGTADERRLAQSV